MDATNRPGIEPEFPRGACECCDNDGSADYCEGCNPPPVEACEDCNGTGVAEYQIDVDDFERVSCSCPEGRAREARIEEARTEAQLEARWAA